MPAQSVFEVIGKISPDFTAPHHLAEWCSVLERAARGEPVRALCTYPIRHFKTETTLHGVILALLMDPSRRIVTMCHDHERAMWLGKRIRELARRTDVGPARGNDTITHWENERGGGVSCMSAEQSREGYDCHMLVCDDPINEKQAGIADKRDAIDRNINYYTSRCMRRGQRGPVLIVMSRFSPDDPIGRRQGRSVERWETLHRPAILDLGLPTERAFAPNVWPIEELRAQRASLAESDPYELVWWSRFQGEPRTSGASVFLEPARYDVVPDWPGSRIVCGFDLSFTSGTKSDYSAYCVLKCYGRKAYVIAAKRFRADLDAVTTELRTVINAYPSAQLVSYMSGPEVSIARSLARSGITINVLHARDPKFVRSQPTVRAWNAGDIMLPYVSSWGESMVSRLESFRGVEADADDEVDALVSAYDSVLGSIGPSGPRTFCARRY